MSNNPYLYEKLVATRHAEIHHAMQRSCKPIRAKQSRTFLEYIADRLGTWLVEQGSRLQRAERGTSIS